ncbi:MAG: carbohydrate ABC transporter permease [Clostridia bacterium]|nr:carbohydrate ABC transporter permease [Clostridia bacterium]
MSDINNTPETDVQETSAELNVTDVQETPGKPTITTMQEIDVQKTSQKQSVFKILGKIAIYTFLIVMAIITIFPFYWMIISSLKTAEEFRAVVPTLFPQMMDAANYTEVFDTSVRDFDILRLFTNTVIVGIVSTLLSLVITIFSAFAFARLEFKGKNALFAALLATMMIPGELFTVTNYVTVNYFGWLNTYTVLIVPFLVSVFYIYLLKQNFMQIPNELYLAAKVDGTGDFKYLCKVMIPLALPSIISITILKMMGAWNSYMWPRLVNTNPDYHLITNGLRNASFTAAEGNIPDTPVQMAAVALVSLPLFLVFIFLRKYIMKGVSRSGIKG